MTHDYAEIPSQMNKVRPVYQSALAECGLACIAMIAEFHGLRAAMVDLRNRYPVSMRGLNLADMIKICEDMGFVTRALSVSLEGVSELALPTILHWDMEHFVVLERVSGRLGRVQFEIVDPAIGRRCISLERFSRSFTGVALEVAAVSKFDCGGPVQKLRLSEVVKPPASFWRAVWQIIALTVVIHAVIITAPIYLKISVDDLVNSGDLIFITSIFGGFLALSILGAIASWTRSRLVSDLSQQTSFELSARTARHLFNLPFSWFEQRFAADVLARFQSIEPITTLITGGIPVAIIDGVLILLSLMAILFISSGLAILSVSWLILYIGLNYLFARKINSLSTEAIAVQARETSSLIESLGGIAAIKASAKEADRFRLWVERKALAVRSLVDVGRMRGNQGSVLGGLSDAANVVAIFVMTISARGGQLSVGDLIGGYFYFALFGRSVATLAAALAGVKSLEVHLERLSDILSNEGEPASSKVIDAPSFRGKIELRDVSFSYGIGERNVLSGVSLVINAGESVAIVGPSGCGKSTLLKLMLGLVTPTQGAVLIDDRPLDASTSRGWRSAVGYVAQDDDLFSGRIQDNITFFSSAADMERVVEVAEIASIHADIVAMPMGYASPVGDMGSAVSGGQRARILLARALYPNPSALFVDEGTAHLDEHTEGMINDAIEKLGISRIIIAHRSSTIASAQRVVEIHGDRIVDVSTSSSSGKVMA